MRKSYIFVILFSIVLCSLLLSEKNMKISHIRNSKYPIDKNFKFELIEETLIEGVDSPDGFIVGIYDMAIDSKENLYLVTWGKVLKYNRDGKFERVFCNIKGEGPGELKSEPFRIFIDKNDNLYITDSFQIVHFNQRGEFVKNIKVFGAEDFVVSKGKYVFCMKYTYKGNRKNKYIALNQFDFSGHIIKELISAEDQITVKMPSRITRFYWHYYTPKIYFNYTKSGGIIFGYNGDYYLYIANPEGKIIKTIEVNIKKEKIKSNEIKALKKTSVFTVNNKNYYRRMPVPQYRPFFNKILCDEKGRIYVVRIQPVLNRKEHEVVDIFSQEGRFLYKVNMPYVPEVIRNGVIYVVDKSDEENIKVKKLVIKNYKDMKE